jgi:monofunctional biosynthetic peptidoglycan transglycosylase
MSDETQQAPIELRAPEAVQPQAPATEAPPSIGRLPEAGRSGFRRYLRWGGYVLGFLIAWPIVMTLVYAVVPPPVSNLMLFRALAGNGIDKQWESLENISPNLPRAVISSEDARFCEHNGVDWVEFQDAVLDPLLDDGEAPSRGASTISMQTAKNLFLWDRRFNVRKMLEVPLALWMDLVWSKRRMIEIYLNIVEWAPGIYGAEAAAQHHFKKSAKNLTRKEAALLAAVLPNPVKRNAGKPSKGVRGIANRIQIRMGGMGPYLSCLGT